MLVYNVPKFTHLNIDAATVARIAGHDNVVGVKDSAGDIAQICDLVRLCPPGFDILIGNGPAFLSGLEMGAVGGILAVANVAPRECVQVYDLALAGDYDGGESHPSAHHSDRQGDHLALGRPGTQSSAGSAGLSRRRTSLAAPARRRGRPRRDTHHTHRSRIALGVGVAVLSCIVLYWSAGGNTERVARAAASGLAAAGAQVQVLPVTDPQAEACDLGAAHLVCLACPSYHFGPPAPMRHFVEQALRRHDVRPTAPARPQRWGVAMVTYAGPHTGIGEALPAGAFLVQGLQHLGRQVRGEWYTVGAFHGDPDQENNRLGFLGDIAVARMSTTWA